MDDIISKVGEMVAHQKLSEAMAYLQDILNQDPGNIQAQALLDIYIYIVKYNNRDIYAATNLDMDPWLE